MNPHSILVLDNCSVHHICEVRQLLRQAGILCWFLPPYSPDLNPIEELFSWIKYYLKRHDDLLQSISDPTEVINAAFEAITPEDCNAWIATLGSHMQAILRNKLPH